MDPRHPSRPDAPAVRPMLRAVLVCDIVGSTALVERLGDARTAALMQRHDQLLLQAMKLCHGQLVDKADGVLALFERPIQALDFALRYQRGLHELGKAEGIPLRARTGIHVGDVMTWANHPRDVQAGAKPIEVEGLAKPVAARLMGLAMPGQVLMSGMAQNLSHRAAGELGERAGRLRWLVHGRYRFKGVPAPMLVHEVGEPGIAPLRAPESGDKAWRELPLWRRPPVIAAEALLLLALGAGLLWSTFRSEPAIAFAERDWVVVADVQNQTGEDLFDDSLDVALRIGLEQSRHVNLVSELQVDRALQRMQRTGQPVDRQLAVELALREGAKAVILPTVAEVGGRVRVSLELIEPTSGNTVLSNFGEGKGREGVLPAMDIALAGTRASLGESVASIEATGKPLEEASTGDLVALKAFSLGVKARYESRLEEAWDLFEEAVRRDPEFSMAYLRMAFLRYSYNDGKGLEHYLGLAQKYRSNLSEREALFLDAAARVPEGPDPTLRRLRVLSAMYPDEYRAYYNYAYFGWTGGQRYRESLEQLAPAVNGQNPARASAAYLQGILHLAVGEPKAAVTAFERAESLGVSGERRAHAEAYASLRRYDDARRVLGLATDTDAANVSFEQLLPLVSFPLDQGHWQAALDEATRQARDAAAVSDLNGWVAEGSLLGLRSYSPDPAFGADVAAYLRSQAALLPDASRFDRRHLVFHVLAAGWMAARQGQVELAHEALDIVDPYPEIKGFPANADMARVLRAELALQAGDADQALDVLASRNATGEELYLAHALRMRALEASGDPAGALAQAEWLRGHRGLAYVEFNSLHLLQPVNIIESNLALASAARLATQLGRKELAATRQAEFASAWPGHADMDVVRRRFGAD
ncbi:putative peptide modification system cyclase [Arenimonas soli]|nr:putative peptide modification system cyclase [Arenimonas soli]